MYTKDSGICLSKSKDLKLIPYYHCGKLLVAPDIKKIWTQLWQNAMRNEQKQKKQKQNPTQSIPT